MEIEESDYGGEATELTGAPSPLTVSIDNDTFIYKPLRLSTGTIHIVGGTELQALFATGWQQYRVTLIDVTAEVERAAWCGFVRPEEYTQDYSGGTLPLDIEVQSAVNVLEQVPYKAASADGKLEFVSLHSLIGRGLAAAAGRYGYVYIPHTFAIDGDHYGENALLREDCQISEQNFFDEEDEPMKYYEILEQICRFAHWTLCDWMGDVWFVDWDYTDAYDCYVLTGETLTLNQQNAASRGYRSVQGIGYHGASHTLDILGGYNKARVKTSNYNCGDKVFPGEDFESLSVLLDRTTETTIGTSKPVVARGRALFVKPNRWEPHCYVSTGYTEDGIPLSSLIYTRVKGETDTYFNDDDDIIHQVKEVDISKYIGNGVSVENSELYAGRGCLFGARLMRWCNWKRNDDGRDSITSYAYDDVILITKYEKYVQIQHLDEFGEIDIFSYLQYFKPDEYAGLFNYSGILPLCAYADGAIGISWQSVPVNIGIPNMTGNYSGYARDGFYYSAESGGYSNNETYFVGDFIRFTLLLRIGNKYWNGTEWQEGEATFYVRTEAVERAGAFVSIYSNKKLDMPYNGLDGYVIPINELLKGELYFSIRDVSRNCAIKDLKLEFKTRDDYNNVYGADSDNGDRIYSNVVNEEFVSELDTIEEKISSYNHDGLCFSKVMLADDYIEEQLYEGVTHRYVRPEEMLLRRIINQYEKPKVKLSQELRYSPELLPADIITDKTQPGKHFVLTGGEIDFENDTETVQMITFED